jgi:septum formation protein
MESVSSTNVQAANKPILPEIVLASASPRRKVLLEDLKIAFKVTAPGVDEKSLDVSRLSPKEKVMALAQFKGASVAKLCPDALVIAADTIVVLGDEVLEKPINSEDASVMLSKLQGSVHSVFSAIAVFYQGQLYLDALETRVKMRALSQADIQQYIATGEPLDKAGAYAIQGYGSVLIEWIEGCYFNVVGMSLILLDKLCREAGVSLVFPQERMSCD